MQLGYFQVIADPVSTCVQVIFAFAMIGVFALILRWTFSREIREHTGGGEAGNDPAEITVEAVAPSDEPAKPIEPAPSAVTPAPAVASEADYGLLASAATVDTREQANRVKALLSQDGIRATTTVGADGRHRVLVFRTDLDRARRVAGSSS